MLTPIQRKLLLKYREHCQKPFTVVGLLVPLLPLAALAAFLVVISFYTFPPGLTLFIAGLLVGIMVRNVALVFHGVRVLPGLLQVIDWEKVDRILGEPSRGAEPRV
jgi:hypothetical protein